MFTELDIYKSYIASPYLSYKHTSYFQVYEDLLSRFRGKEFTFVEIGVLNGGSLFMWRNFFGPQARIIGIDLNPLAKRWTDHGFEIFIGSQSNPLFWDEFFKSVGLVDVILDDGGHTDEQQIITTNCCIPFIKDSGLLMVEDVHASYLKDFGNPSKYSYINYSKKLIDETNARFPGIHDVVSPLNKYIYSIQFYESIVAFQINRDKCFRSEWATNSGISLEAEDFRYADSALHQIANFLTKLFGHVGIKFSMGKFIKRVENYSSKIRIKKFF